MGRCNNRSTQQAAEAMRNTPARARFSKGQAAKNTAASRRPKNNSNNTEAARGAVAAGGPASAPSSSLPATKQQPQPPMVERKQKLVQKIAQRVASNTLPLSSSSSLLPGGGIDSKNLDEVKLSAKSIDLIFQLLKDLNVVIINEKERAVATTNTAASNSHTKDEANADDYADNADDYYNDKVHWNVRDGVLTSSVEGEEAYFSQQQTMIDGATYLGNRAIGGYEEYEEDKEEEEFFDTFIDGTKRCRRRAPLRPMPTAGGDDDETNWDNGSQQRKEHAQINTATTEGTKNDPVASGTVIDERLLKQDPVYVHLTTKLSFTPVTAARACRAVETWSTGQPNRSDDSKNKNDVHKLSLVMDWLCLHLTETELETGFRPSRTTADNSNNNGNFAAASAGGGTSRSNVSGILLAGTGRTKAIPHPSITVAKKWTETVEWRRQTMREEQAVHFMKLGFEHSEIIKVLLQANNDAIVTCPALSDNAMLRVLLTSLERRVLIGDGTAATEDEQSVDCDDDDDDAEIEREQEREALSAIYEDQFEIVTDAKAQSRYKITVLSHKKDEEHSSMGDLHVFVRPGYPAHRTPLFLLHNQSLPWDLLRLIHAELLRHAQEGIGGPVIFEAVTHLMDSYSEMLVDYRNEQRTREFEETQLRLRREAGHDVEADEALLADMSEVDMKNLSRRQRSKLKGAEKAFDRNEKEIKAEERRRELNEARLERIQSENKYIRQSLADKVILQREQESQVQELRKVSRAAMSLSLNRGKSVEESRTDARKAELEYRKAHGMEMPDGHGIEEIAEEDVRSTDPVEKSGLSYEAKATPTTLAFMDRLRDMYANAARLKGGFELSEPAAKYKEQLEKRPCPIAVPVGDLARIMEDHIVSVQEDQPWLVAPEARVPGIADYHVSGSSDFVESAPELTERQKDISRKLQKDLANSLQHPSKQVQRIREQTHQLPAYQMRDEIVATIRANQVTLISASTGAGKTTAVPTLLLNDMIQSGLGSNANIWVTQPRRISAIGVAERIASERGEKVGETCGYSIKLEKKCSKRTRITLCTTGILLRRLQCDPDLANMSHLVIDEVHERDINSDFALIILKDLLQRRKSLKLILMSATFDKDIFASYFDGCATVDIPGRAHAVKEFRLEDVLELTRYKIQEGSDCAVKEKSEIRLGRLSKSALKKLYYPKYSSKTIQSLSIVDESVINYELLAALIEHLSLNGEEGAILVFMPGMAEISNAIDEVRKKEFFQSEKVVIYPLHSSLSTSEQTQVFEVPPVGVRKIVVATNIAETSITVSDVLYVVDSGRVKENRRDEIKEAPTLVDCWVSKASAQQRRGRAGRTRPGISYHLFSSHTYSSELQEYQLPEISRVGIEDLVLQVLILDLGEPSKFLAGALTPPSAIALRSSLKLLEELGAVECRWQASFFEEDNCASLADTTTELTALGFHLATLPVEPHIGKLIIYGALFGCVEPALTIAAAMSSKSPFLSPFGNRDAADEARRTFSVDDSDHLTILEAFNQWKALRARSEERATNDFVRDRFLSRMTLYQMDELRKQYAALLSDIGFLPSGYRLDGNTRGPKPSPRSGPNVNVGNTDLLKAVLCAGLYPNIILAPRPLVNGTSKQEAGELAFHSRSKGNVYLHPATLLFSAKQLEYRYCCFREIMQTRKLYIRDATVVSPFALLLFGGALQVYHTEGIVTVDEWLKFRIARTPATLVKHLRSQMESMLLRKIVAPEDDVTSTSEAKAVIESISTLLQHEKLAKQGDAARTDGAEIVHPFHRMDSGAHANGSGRFRGGVGRGRGRQSGGRGRGRG